MPAIAHQNKIIGNTNNLNDLSNVNITSPTNGQLFAYNGSEWENSSLRLYQILRSTGGTELLSTDDLDSQLAPKTYFKSETSYKCVGEPTQLTASNKYVLEVRQADDETTVGSNSPLMQIIYALDTSTGSVSIYTRGRMANDWGPWVNIQDDTEAIHWSEASKSVKKNLLKNTATSTTINGVTFTVNADGSVTANGTATALAVFDVVNTQLYSWKPRFDAGSYKLSCEGVVAGTSYFALTIIKGGTTYYDYLRVPEGTSEITWTDADISDITDYFFGVCIQSGQTVNNVTFYPMLRLASIEDDTYEPYIPDNVELNELKADKTQITNPNLLDNPWFTVNQRGQASYIKSSGSGNLYTVDRWYLDSATNDNDSVAINADGSVTVTFQGANSSFRQRLPQDILNRIVNKYVTLSILLSDGSIIYDTGYIESPTSQYHWPIVKNFGSGFSLRLVYNTDLFIASIDTTDNVEPISIKAIKLELGSISTLAMDTAPNIAEETLKCQRYFVRYATNNTARLNFNCIQSPIVLSDNTKRSVYITGTLPTTMRTTPSIYSNDITKWFMFYGYNDNLEAKFMQALGIERINGNNVSLVGTINSDNTQFGIYGQLWCDTANSYIDFNADL